MEGDPCVLAFDTALGGCSVGVLTPDGDCVEEITPGERGQAEILVPMIDGCLRIGRIGYDEIDAIATTVGPGSFTGLRVGLSTARAMGLALKKPVIGVTTLEAVARQALALDGLQDADALLVVLETKRRDFYFQIFYLDGSALSGPAAADAERIALAVAGKRVVVTGDAVARFGKEAGIDDVHLHPNGNSLIKPSVLAAIGKEKLKNSREFPPPMPLYLREADVTLK